MEIADGASFVLTRKSVAGALPFPLVVAVSSQPTIRGQISFSLPHEYNISSLSATEFTILWSVVKEFVVDINNASETAVRYAAATDGKANIQLFALRLRSQEWQPIIHPEEFFSERYPGYLTTQNGPRAESETLHDMQARITRVSGWSSPSFAFLDPTDDNLFARLVRGEIPQWRVWEDDHHVAFLTPFPNVPGLIVVIPRRHLSSDILSLEDTDFVPLVDAAWKVARFLQEALNVSQVGMFLEGFEIDYAHIKLAPVPVELSETSDDGNVGIYYDDYPGFITTQPGPVRDDAEIQAPSYFEDVRRKWM